MTNNYSSCRCCGYIPFLLRRAARLTTRFCHNKLLHIIVAKACAWAGALRQENYQLGSESLWYSQAYCATCYVIIDQLESRACESSQRDTLAGPEPGGTSRHTRVVCLIGNWLRFHKENDWGDQHWDTFYMDWIEVTNVYTRCTSCTTPSSWLSKYLVAGPVHLASRASR